VIGTNSLTIDFSRTNYFSRELDAASFCLQLQLRALIFHFALEAAQPVCVFYHAIARACSFNCDCGLYFAFCISPPQL
jgi:hypothetical protein